MERRLRSSSSALVLALALFACANPDSTSKPCQSDADCPSGQVCRDSVCVPPGVNPTDGGALFDGGAMDGGAADGGGGDAGLVDGGADGGSDGGADGGDAGLPGRGFGEHCESHGDCQSQLCLDTGRGGICTIQCRGDCPPNYVCKSYTLDHNRLVNLCTPVSEVYCVRCEASADCNDDADRCTNVGGATFCTKDCAATGVCPPGYDCRDVPLSSTSEGASQDAGTSVDGGTEPNFRQCLPTGGQCPGCIDRDGDRYGVGADCLGPDCDDTNPNIHPGATEVCDGVDNNCDGRIDEGFDQTSDDRNCGGCGIACDTANGQRCCNSHCIDTRTSLEHCGACGHPCSGDGAACCAGLCRATQTDPANCGGCALACTNDHGGLGCAAGHCAPSCANGYGDCDGDPKNGCETRLNAIDNCGACGVVCRNSGGTTSCVAGQCEPVCGSGFASCDDNPVNGCETNTNTSTQHCGRCQNPCANANGQTACDNGVCRPTCALGFGDCDGEPRNGCETPTTTTLAHCGACNAACVNANGTTRCDGGVCIPTCAPGFADCNGNPRDGCESSIAAVSVCGTCAADADCIDGFYCDTGVCHKKKPNGDACTVGTDPAPAGRECTSGFCVDGVCCQTGCDGICRSCNLQGAAGQCKFIPAGQDPENECDADPVVSCGQDGTCDGAGACRVYTAGTICVAQSCAAGSQSNQRICDGFRNCMAASPPSTLCAPYTCGAAGCNAACTTNAQCADGFACVGGVCKVAGGQACNGPADCASGNCVDGVCCNEPCNGLCEKCNLPGSIGVCSAIPAGADPDNECDEQPASTCGRNGACSGTRGLCALHPAGTVCTQQTCTGGTQSNTKVCDGQGACLTPNPATVPCYPYLCSGSTQACFATCATPEQCSAGHTCVEGACKKSGGEQCAADAECASGFCTDGVCCESRCHGVCEKCNQANRVGLCDPVPAGQDPDDECVADSAASCGQTGACSGQRACALYALGTVCNAAFCSGNTSNLADLCDGQGHCTDSGTTTCAPFTCDGLSGLCRATCAAAGDCISGFECAGGVCKKSKAQACAADGECASGFCTDGVCCESRCGGVCEKCSLAGRAGFCDAIAAGQDPDDECATAAVSTCKQNGSCSGQRSCALYASGTVCQSAACSGNVSSLANTCDGQGTCVGNGTRVCFPFVCDAASGLCKSQCAANADCQSGYECAGGTCKKSQAQACTADADCASGFCTDNVCCQSRCGGTCEKCNQGARAGFCDPVAAGQDPDGECVTEAASTCGKTGVCDGARACARYAAGTVCVAASCSGTTSNLADTCDGQGHCQDNGTQACSPFACNAATGLCRTNCSVNTDCVTGYDCTGGVCKKSKGETCGTDGDCASGFCTDQVCCESRCGGVCEKCSLTGRLGFCDAISAGQNPDNECQPAQTASTCGRTGVCSGNRSCQLFASGTVCVAASCASNVSSLADTCNGQGQCVDNGTQNCAPLTCNTATGLCRASCTVNTDCVTGYQCVSGTCKKSSGQTCSTGAECASTFCTDGVCCQSACGGVCEKCNQTGRLGFCDAIAAGTDPDNECPTDPIASCGRTGQCSGSRSCAFYVSGTVCLAASCAANISTSASLCNGTGGCVAGSPTACAPLTCNGTTGLCLGLCATNTDCVAGYDCVAGACKKSKGQGCGLDGDCASGFCTDGVCCESRCGGTCEKCNQTNRLGYCDAVPSGTDPDNECAFDTTNACGTTGMCSGARTCQLQPSGTLCVPATCSGNTSTSAALCNGTGTCVPGTATNCSPAVCDPGSGLCRSTCSTTGDCVAGYQCVSGTCKKSNGQTCSVGTECASTFCTDGVCCESLCGGTCEKCNQSGRLGYCDAVPAGSDPDNECPADPQSGCQRNGLCSGTRSCALYSFGTVCNAPVCSGNVSNFADTCNGTGTCVDNGTQSCFPYLCQTASGLCASSCTLSTDCVTGYQCVGAVCKKSSGLACALGTECASGFCTDGVCCQSACGGSCEKCNQTGREGYCDPIPAGTDPDSECPTDAVSGCQRNGFCNGARACQLYASGTICVAASCSADGNTANNASTCSGTGTCASGGTTACLPYKCAGGACKTSCTVTADCQTGYDCFAGVCKKIQGQTCAVDADCGSGFCTDGVCCQSRCAGVCEKCSQSGRLGYCDPIPAGTDPDNECATDAAATCQKNGFCSGSRACQLYASGTVCLAASCTANVSSLADLCNGTGTCVDSGTQNCAPYVCSGTTGLCKSACAIDADCVSGYGCASGTCKKVQGSTCAVDADCQSGFCTDGYCCQSRCGGTCEKCSLTGRAGYCDPIPTGTDPDNECPTDAVSGCQRNGLCSGSRSCQLYASGTTCVAASCSADGNTAYNGQTCNGSGTCSTQTSTACAPYKCSTGACRTTCSVDADCQTGFACAGGVCKKAQGVACALDGDCASGFCTDGVCCAARCGGVCEKCNQASRLGFCDAIPNGTDPDAECADAGATSCGLDGYCSGSRSCRYYSSTTVCVAPTCATTTSWNKPDLCNGTGTCVDQGVQDCTPYICGSAAGGCKTSCTTSADCASGYGCAGSVCKKVDGGTCSVGTDCVSGTCCSGFCRNLTSDTSNCGACGRVCALTNASSNVCAGGNCSPVCNALWGNCDGDNTNACETALQSTTASASILNCGSCGSTCAPPNVSTVTCPSGTCTVASCQNGWANCDGNNANGCERNLNPCPPTGCTLQSIGTYDGDSAGCTQRFTTSGNSEASYVVTIHEGSSWCYDLKMRVELSVPAGMDYDLVIDRGAADSCSYWNGTAWVAGSCTSARGPGLLDSVFVYRADDCFGADSSFTASIHVRFYSGNMCANWGLTVYSGTDC